MEHWINTVYNMLITKSELLVAGLFILLIARFLWSDLFNSSAVDKIAFCVIGGLIVVSLYVAGPVIFWR